MSLIVELKFYQAKIMNFLPKTLKLGNQKLKQPETLLKRIELLMTYWDKFQTFYNHFVEEAELNPDLHESKINVDKMNEKVQQNYTQTMNTLREMLESQNATVTNEDLMKDVSNSSSDSDILLKKDISDDNVKEIIPDNDNSQIHSENDEKNSVVDGEELNTDETEKTEENLNRYECDDDGLSLSPKISNRIQSSERLSMSSEPDKSKSRRKPTHSTLIVDNNVTFETCVMPEEEDKETAEPKVKRMKRDNSLSENPNGELMRKVAFLRSCVNYIMLRLGYKHFEFRRGVSMPWLMSEFIRNKSRRQVQKSISDICKEDKSKR